MSDELINIDELDSLEQFETERGPTSRPLVTTVRFDIGYYAYVKEPKDPMARFFSVLEHGKAKANKLWEEMMEENNKEIRFPPNLHLEIVLSLGNVLNRTEEDMPNWKTGYRSFYVPTNISSPEDKEDDDWVPYPYEILKESMLDAQRVLDLDKIGKIMRTEIYCEVRFEQNQWDLWQIARAKAGERTFKRYAKMEEADVEWLPVFNGFFSNREEASKGLGMRIPDPPELWDVEKYQSWNSYFLHICKVISEGNDATELAFSDNIDGKEVQIVTEEHLNEAKRLVESGEYEKEDVIPF